MKLKNAAQTTATPGVRTRVETTVAIELALSWKPLMKSKISATPMIDQDIKDVVIHAQACLMEMDSSTLPASSMWSSVFSRLS